MLQDKDTKCLGYVSNENMLLMTPYKCVIHDVTRMKKVRFFVISLCLSPLLYWAALADCKEAQTLI